MTPAFVPISLHVAGYLPRAVPRCFKELPVDDFQKSLVLGTFTAQVIAETGPRQKEQSALAPDTEIEMILPHRFLPLVPRMSLEASAKKSRSTTNWSILA